jgi:hypothetical protein
MFDLSAVGIAKVDVHIYPRQSAQSVAKSYSLVYSRMAGEGLITVF